MGVVTFGWSIWLAMFVGSPRRRPARAAARMPTLRLQADYFAITSIAAARSIRLSCGRHMREAVTGGVVGLQSSAVTSVALNPFRVGSRQRAVQGDQRHLWVLVVGWGLARRTCRALA